LRGLEFIRCSVRLDFSTRYLLRVASQIALERWFMSAIANTRALETRSFSRAILKEALTQNVFLQSGDTVMVSRAGIVYVSGDVKTPGGYVMNNDENLTVLQALALAQGLNPTSTKNVCINPPKRWQVAGNSYRTEADYDG